MNSRRAGVAAILFIFALLLLWVFSKYLPQKITQLSSDTLILTHTSLASGHRYGGKVPLAAPCDGVGVSVSTNTDTSTQVTLTTQRLPGATCLAEQTLVPFSFSLDHRINPEDLSVTLDGATIPAQIVEE